MRGIMYSYSNCASETPIRQFIFIMRMLVFLTTNLLQMMNSNGTHNIGFD